MTFVQRELSITNGWFLEVNWAPATSSNTSSTMRRWKLTCLFRLKPNRNFPSKTLATDV